MRAIEIVNVPANALIAIHLFGEPAYCIEFIDPVFATLGLDGMLCKNPPYELLCKR